MDNKFYVSLEAARLLKEKGYDGDAEYAYHENGNFSHWGRNVNDIDYLYAAPTKAETIDWLESKGIVIIVDEYYIMHEEDDYYTSCWGYYIRKDDEGVCRDNSSEYKTRLEAKDAAIIKACELLTNEN